MNAVLGEAASLIALLSALQFKHLLADFWWQSDWMIRHKGRFGHPGGIAHSGLHAGLTAAILWALALPTALVALLAAVEFVLHYLIDWVKARHAERAGAGPEDPRFWRALGFDQWAHQMTYLALAAAAAL